MFAKLDQKITDTFTKDMLSAYVFDLLLTLIIRVLPFLTLETELFGDKAVIILEG